MWEYTVLSANIANRRTDQPSSRRQVCESQILGTRKDTAAFIVVFGKITSVTFFQLHDEVVLRTHREPSPIPLDDDSGLSQ